MKSAREPQEFNISFHKHFVKALKSLSSYSKAIMLQSLKHIFMQMRLALIEF